ncbi:hypothetical protein CRP01_34030 [Flavilitoribacter nigricans DSM 23189 = NBRC 102662]|uniref:Tetratricopeptide repeat protein n=1 Tax=Flavilitoribacter nigricans (strain ATCC 23147 / DSM 23189 / NBRC 102662 / NCIMB 1420 / SS-2) TaxID=1122177 RepID=A0A2D0N0N8_FLAN2|nr:hypothetical protein CRP01_34030 [Flavilitoribacter nigricans DSM 23189 = NBRC 102662]
MSRAIREARIAVLPFENHTDDPSLDVLGVMASDWIIQGLVYLGNVQIVSFENIQDNLKFAQNDNGWEQFAARTGAEKVLKGTYQLDGQELVFQSEVIDTETGQAELVMPTVKGPKGKQLLLVSQLQQKFATAFAAKGHEFSPGVAQDPPAYDAYQLYQKGTDLYSTNFAGCIELLNQAIQKDSSFFMPYLFVTGAYFMDGEKVKADSVFGLINRRIDIERLPQTHMQWYLHWKAILNKDLRTAYEAIIKNFEIDPKQLMTNLETGIIANDLNMPEKSVRILGAIDPEHVDLRHEFNTWWHRHYAHNLYRLGRYEEAEQILKRIPPNLRKHWNYYDRMAEILIAKHQEERLEDLMQDLLHSDRLVSDKLLTFLFVSERYGHRKRETEQNYWAERGLAWAMEQSDTQETNSYLLGNLYYLAGQFQKALPWLQKATREKGPNWLQVTKEGPGWLQLSRLGSCYLALGERAKAQDTLLEMDKWYDKTKDAGYLIAQAHLYARQNDKERAMDLIREAFNKAHPYDPSGYENDFLFVPLQGYPPFENFVHPKG